MAPDLQRVANAAADWLYSQARKTAWEVKDQQVDYITKYTLYIVFVLSIITAIAQVWMLLLKPYF